MCRPSSSSSNRYSKKKKKFLGISWKFHFTFLSVFLGKIPIIIVFWEKKRFSPLVRIIFMSKFNNEEKKGVNQSINRSIKMRGNGDGYFDLHLQKNSSQNLITQFFLIITIKYLEQQQQGKIIIVIIVIRCVSK